MLPFQFFFLLLEYICKDAMGIVQPWEVSSVPGECLGLQDGRGVCAVKNERNREICKTRTRQKKHGTTTKVQEKKT